MVCRCLSAKIRFSVQASLSWRVTGQKRWFCRRVLEKYHQQAAPSTLHVSTWEGIRAREWAHLASELVSLPEPHQFLNRFEDRGRHPPGAALQVRGL